MFFFQLYFSFTLFLDISTTQPVYYVCNKSDESLFRFNHDCLAQAKKKSDNKQCKDVLMQIKTISPEVCAALAQQNGRKNMLFGKSNCQICVADLSSGIIKGNLIHYKLITKDTKYCVDPKSPFIGIDGIGPLKRGEKRHFMKSGETFEAKCMQTAILLITKAPHVVYGAMGNCQGSTLDEVKIMQDCAGVITNRENNKGCVNFKTIPDSDVVRCAYLTSNEGLQHFEMDPENYCNVCLEERSRSAEGSVRFSVYQEEETEYCVPDQMIAENIECSDPDPLTKDSAKECTVDGETFELYCSGEGYLSYTPENCPSHTKYSFLFSRDCLAVAVKYNHGKFCEEPYVKMEVTGREDCAAAAQQLSHRNFSWRGIHCHLCDKMRPSIAAEKDWNSYHINTKETEYCVHSQSSVLHLPLPRNLTRGESMHYKHGKRTYLTECVATSAVLKTKRVPDVSYGKIDSCPGGDLDSFYFLKDCTARVDERQNKIGCNNHTKFDETSVAECAHHAYNYLRKTENSDDSSAKITFAVTQSNTCFLCEDNESTENKFSVRFVVSVVGNSRFCVPDETVEDKLECEDPSDMLKNTHKICQKDGKMVYLSCDNGGHLVKDNRSTQIHISDIILGFFCILMGLSLTWHIFTV